MILLDTDVVSFFFKGDPRTAAYEQHLVGERLAVSFMTAAELYVWAERRAWGERRREELEYILTQRYTVLGFELGLTKEWARVRAEGWRQGHPIVVQDAWVAATARYHAITLVTHNAGHFKHVAGLRVVGEAD